MASKTPKKTTRKKKANGYQMPGHIPKGEVLRDTNKIDWVLDTSIGIGGFGEIYSASKEDEKSKQNYVIKIEPLENGPLFCERNVYVRIGKREHIKEFMELKKLKFLGMPQFYGFGSHEYNGTKYRFLVMERYGKDLWSLFLENKKQFPAHTVFKVAAQILDVLEYMHSKQYVHADVKGANLLLGTGKAVNQVFLVDLGLACKYQTTEFKADPRKAHNGTIEYTSRDAHTGAPTRRGDIEILGYNMIHWLSSTLPWEGIKDPVAVHESKKKHMKNMDGLLTACFKSTQPPAALQSYLKQLCLLDPLDAPDYPKLSSLLMGGVKQYGRVDGPLTFSPLKSPKKRVAAKEAVDDTVVEKTKPRQLVRRRSKSVEPSKPKTEVAVKRSWRDCPTIVNGAGVKSGALALSCPPSVLPTKRNRKL